MKVAYCLPKDPQIPDAITYNPGRSSQVHSLVLSLLSKELYLFHPSLATAEQMEEYHDSDYIQRLLNAKESNYWQSDASYFPLLSEYCKYIAGSSISCAKLLASGQTRIAVNLDGGRHHAS